MNEITERNAEETSMVKAEEFAIDLGVPTELAKGASAALAKCEKTLQIYNRSRTGMMLRNITMGTHYNSPMRMMRQLASEMQRKKDAMVENYYRIKKKLVQARIQRRKAEETTDELERELALVRAEEIEAQAMMAQKPYTGALREVKELERIYDALEKRVREEHGKLDEEVYEKEEARYWVKRAIAQSLWDVRASGRIGAGNQELLEQIGLNPRQVLVTLIQYDQENPKSHTTEEWEQFLEASADAYEKESVEKVKRQGLPFNIETGHLLIEESTNEQDVPVSGE